MLSNNRYKSQRRDLIQTQGSDDILVSGGLGGTTGKYMLAAKPGLITQRQTGARYSEEQVLNGLIGWWFLAEPLGTGTYYDFSGSDATIAVSSGSVPTEYTGIYGIVPRIDVGSGILSVSTAISISKFAPLTNASWTVATWVRFDTTAGVGNGGIADISENLVDAGKAFSIYRDTSSGVITYTLSGTISTISTTTVPLVGRWYHLALSYEYAPATGTGTYRIYLDGVLENTLTGGLPFAGNLANSGSIMRIGYIALGTIYLGGALNDFRVYRRALSTTEVGYLVGLKYGRLVPGLAAFGGNTTQTTRWQSGPINTNQLGQFVSEIGQSADGAPFQQTGQPVQPAAYALRGHWPLAGDNTNYIVDTSGAQISGTFGAGTAVGTQISDPEIGTMLALNGSPDYVNLTSAAGKMSFVNSGSFAVCMWVKLNNQYSSSNDPFFELGMLLVPPVGTGSHIYAFREVGTRKLIFTFYNNQLSSTLTLDNTLSHLAFTYNRSSRIRQIWINGQLAGQDTNVNPPLLTSLTRFRVGFNGNPSSVYLSGAISDFRIYSTALTQIEILQIIRQKLVNPGIDRRGLLANTRLIMPLSDPQTVGTSLSNIQDLSGYGHMGTPANTQQILSIGTKKGISFSSASSQRITIPSTTAISITDALTISFWIYPTSLASQITVISKQSYGEYEVVINTSGYIIFRHGSGVAGTQTNYTTEIPVLTANQWVYINVTRVSGSLNNKSVSVWVNGISYSLFKTGTSETTYTIGSAGSSVFIGSTPSGTEYANMILSGLELSAICWTPNEIRARMLQNQPQSFPVSSSLASISANAGDNLTLHLNAKDVAVLGSTPSNFPDYSGYGHTANVKPVAGAVGLSAVAALPSGNRSFIFNGSTGYLICDGGAAGREYLGPSGGTARTISMWVYPMSIGSANQPLISWGSALANTTAGGSFDAYLNTGGNLVVALNSQADFQITQTWDTRLTTGNWRQISLVVDPTAQPAEIIKCYTANATLSPSAANLVAETSNTTPNQLVCLLDLAEETPNGRLTDSSGYGNHASYVGQRWTSAGTFTYARIAHKQYELGGTIYIVGGVRSPGVYTGTVETFNGTTWAIGTALPQERAYHGGAVYNSSMYAIGGRITASGTATNTVITSTGGTWSSTTSLSGIRVECAAAVLGDYLYAIGGLTTGTGTTYLSSVERFNGSTWTTTTSMNTARASPSVAVFNGYIYVMGGYNSTDLQLRTVERFDGSTWTLMPPMNYARHAASAIVQGNYIYIIGGATTGGATINSVERFDGQRWTVIGTFPQALSYAAAGIYSAGNYLLHTGGSPTGAGSTSINTSYRAIKPVGLWGEPVTWMNGVESNIVIPASTTTNLAANSAHTISLWAQPSNIALGTLFSAENTSSQDLCAVRINASGRVVYTMTNAGATTNTVSSNSALTANSWVHITTTYDGTNMRLFLDGALTNTTASSGTTAAGTPRDIYIGADWNTAAKDYYSGNLGECRVYRAALTTNSVGALYSIGTQGINRSLVRTQPSAQLTIGRGFTGSQQATNFYSGYMDDIRVYDGLALSYPDLVAVWSNGAGNYYVGTNWQQSDTIALGNNSSGVVLSSAPIPRQLANQTYYTATYTPGTGGLSYKGPAQEFPTGTFDLSGKILTYTPNTTATGYTWTVAAGTNWTTTPPGTYSAYSNTFNATDDTANTIILLNQFKFYNTNYSTIYVTPNGYLDMLNASADYSGTYTQLYSRTQIAAGKRDLDARTSGGLLYFGYANSSPSTPNDTFITTWANVANFGDAATRNSFQIVIYLNNAPATLAGNIIVNYGSVGTTGAQLVSGLSNGGGESLYITDGRGVDLSAGAPVSPDVYTLTATTSNLATRPSNITPATLISQSLTCSNLVITNPLVQPYNLASNLTGWWQLNDLPASGTSNTLVDSSGLGHTATKTGPGQSLWLVSPQNQPAIYLNGTQQNITIKDGSSATFPVSGSDYSISGWFNCFSNTSGANNAIIGISTNADTDRLVVYSAPDSNLVVSTSAANTTGLIPATGNAWNHLVITGTSTDALGSNTRVYLNNYQIANTAATTTFASNDKFYLGSKRTTTSGGTSTNYFTGLLSDFRIYNRRLQPTEITQIYRGGNHGVMQTDADSGVYSLACGGVPGIGSSTNSRLIKLVSPGFAQPPATPREPQQGNLGISVRVKLDAAQPSIATLASSETAGAAGSWQLLTAPPQLQALKLWFALNDGVGATTAYNGAHTSPTYNATYTGSGFTWQLASPYGGVAPVFNGSANYVLVDNGTGLNADTLVGADITICGWVNTNSAGAGTRTVFGISASGTGTTVLGLQLVGTGNILTAVVGSQTVSATGRAPLNTWCFVALTIRAGIYVSLYLNNGGRAIGTPPAPYGADYYTATLTTPLAISDTNMIYIGAQPGSPSTTNYFSGGLCDIRVYNRALEPSEIESSYYNRMLPYFILNTAVATSKVLAVGKTSLEPDKWHHIAMNYLAAGRPGQLGCAEIWVNGALSGSGHLADLGIVPSTAAGLAANTTANIIIGSSILSSGENARSYLNGRIDDLRISRQPFEPGVIQSIASGWQDCILAIGAVGLSGTANTSAVAIGSAAGSTTTTSAANGINGAGVLVDISSGYAAERRDYSNQISVAGGVQVCQDRQLGTQLIFNGTTSYCAVSGYLAQAYHRIFAISCWITPDATQMTGTDTQIITKWTGSGDGSSCYKLAYDFTTNTITASVGIGSRTVSVSATCLRVLAHIVMQTTHAELILYINGAVAGVAQLATTAGASGIINVSNNVAVRIGCGSYGQAGTFFKGSITGLRVFETVLPLATISDLAGGRIAGGSAQTTRMPQIGYDSSRRPQINSGLVFWLSNPQLDLSGANIASIAGVSYPQIRMSENSVYRARGVASNCVVLSGNTGASAVGVASLGSGIQTLGSANSNLIFDGSDVLAQLSGCQTFSVAFWAKFFNSSPASNETVLSLRDPSATTANTMIEIVRASGTKAVSMNFGTGTATETANTLVIADTNWHHWVITYGANSSVSNSSAASSKRNYYLDGVRIAVSSAANIGRPMLSNCGVLALGTDYYTGGTDANIGIQDLRIYNRVLGVDEVGLLYNMPQSNSVVAGTSNSSIGGSTPLELVPVSGGSSGYEIIGMRKRLVSPNGIPVSGVSGDVAAGDIIDVVGAGSGPARDSLVCAVGASPSSSGLVADQNWQVKPSANYRSAGYISNVSGLLPSVASNLVLSGGATSNTILGVSGSPAEILLGNSSGSVYLGTGNLVVERRDWTVSFGVSAAGTAFSNAALMTIQGATPSSTNRSWWVNSSNAGELMFQIDSGGTANGTGVFLPADGRWTHLAITKGQLLDGLAETANTMSIYQDGVCRWQRVVDLNPSGEQFITLGATSSILSGVGFTGRLRDIQVYNSCLGAGQIRNLAQPGNQLMGVSSPSRPTGAPLHHWLFATATSSNTVPDLGVLGSALGLSASGVNIQYRNQANENWSRVAMPGLPSDAVAYFNGSGEAVAYSCPVSRDAARTVAFWMRRSTIGVLDEGLVTWGTGSVSGGWMNIGLNSTGQISVRTSSTMTPRVVSTTAITDNRWYHVCVVCLPPGNSLVGGMGTADNIRVFINGYHDTLAPFGSGFDTSPINTVKSSSSSSDWLYVGSAGAISYFSGWMDDVRVYGYALTPEEVLGLSKGAGQLAVVRV